MAPEGLTISTQQLVPPTTVAEREGLLPACRRPDFVEYLRQLWSRRHFIVSYTRAASVSTYSRSTLGQAWQLLTPTLNAGMYYLIFGLLLKTSRGIDDYVGFLIIGLFAFHFMQHSVQMASGSVTANINLIRSMQFPRAGLPIGTTAMQLQRLAVAMLAVVPIILITGERPGVRWLLAIPALALMGAFILGLSLVTARIGWRIPDTAQTLPFVLRAWLFASGIFYSIDRVAHRHSHWVGTAMHLQPGALYIDMLRAALLKGYPLYKYDVVAGVGWAGIALVVGLVVFWQAEERYGGG